MACRSMLWLLAVSVVACSASPASLDQGASKSADGGAPDTLPTIDAGPTKLAITWNSCTLSTTTAQPAECANVEVPYRWSDPGGRKITLFIKRYRVPNARGQLWLLQGGPGAAVESFDSIGPYYRQLGVDLDFYMLDQRGAGKSSRLGCPVEESPASAGGRSITFEEWPACIGALQAAWGPNLPGFTVTETARDLGELINAVRSPGDRVIVYGVSYATYLLNRYLQLYPDQPSGVVLDSICGVGECSFSRSDARFNEVARQYVAACGADAFCAARLGPDPWARLGKVLDALDTGHCPAAVAAGLDRTAVRRATAQLLYHWESRILILALVRRLERCAASDLPVLQRLGQGFSALPSATSLQASSPALANHIGLTELWDEPSPTRAQFLQQERQQYVSNGTGSRFAALRDIWPRAGRDIYYGKWATTRVPMLMLNGALDPATPLGTQDGTRQAFNGANQTFVALPRVTHSVISESPVANAPPCGTSLVVSFARNPTASVDTTCVSKVLPLQFETSTAATTYFGTSNIWGD